MNNAANDERHSLETVTEDFWDDRMNVNLKHYFFAIQSVYKDMKKLGDGKIVNIGSFSWMLGSRQYAGIYYCKVGCYGIN